MPSLRSIWLLLTFVALLGVDAACSQLVSARGSRGEVAAERQASRGGPIDVAPTPDGDRLARAELVARARRRSRDEPDRPATLQIERGAAFEGVVRRAAAIDGDRGATPVGGDRRALHTQRRAWAEAAKRLRARPAYGTGPEPPPCVVTFGIDGPRLVPLTLFD